MLKCKTVMLEAVLIACTLVPSRVTETSLSRSSEQSNPHSADLLHRLWTHTSGANCCLRPVSKQQSPL